MQDVFHHVFGFNECLQKVKKSTRNQTKSKDNFEIHLSKNRFRRTLRLRPNMLVGAQSQCAEELSL